VNTLAIDIENFLKPIGADKPCGDNLEYDADFLALANAIKGKPSTEPNGEPEPPNWKEIKRDSEILLKRTIHLDLLVFYSRALIATDGFLGLQAALKLTSMLIEENWKTIYPELDPDDDDPIERINILTGLSDFETILKPLQRIPLIESPSFGLFSLRDINIANGKITATDKTVNQSTIDASIQDANLEKIQIKYQEITNSLESIKSLEDFLDAELGSSNTLNLSELKKLLKECSNFLSHSLSSKGVENDVILDENQLVKEEEKEGGLTNRLAVKSPTGSIENNQDVIRVLKAVCEYYQKNEPSSPVPILVERSIKLVGKSFIDIMKDIAPQGLDQVYVIRGEQDDE
jgi:type VI secretion system protein ImpA